MYVCSPSNLSYLELNKKFKEFLTCFERPSYVNNTHLRLLSHEGSVLSSHKLKARVNKALQQSVGSSSRSLCKYNPDNE